MCLNFFCANKGPNFSVFFELDLNFVFLKKENIGYEQQFKSSKTNIT